MVDKELESIFEVVTSGSFQAMAPENMRMLSTSPYKKPKKYSKKTYNNQEDEEDECRTRSK